MFLLRLEDIVGKSVNAVQCMQIFIALIIPENAPKIIPFCVIFEILFLHQNSQILNIPFFL